MSVCLQRWPNLVICSCVPAVVMAEEHCVLQRSWQMWWKGSLGSPRAAGWDLGTWAFFSGLVSWLRLSLGVWQSCPCTPGKTQAQAVSESIRSSVCPVFTSCLFPLWPQLLWPGVFQVGFPELYPLQRFAVLRSSARCSHASFLESLCHYLCK